MYVYNAPKSADPNIPPIAPSIVLLGLKIGDSLCFPNNIPVQYAQVSDPQLGIKINQTKYLP